ncbi:hypothetical protein HYV84_08070 [Candidatus Woesearchaeota archaeon]|nr:hypothetical protein [Candidatus Woesearchaeota archaeon]
MVEGLGLKGKDINNLLVKAIQMRFDARHVTRDWASLEKLSKELTKYERKHNIKKIEEVEKTIEKTGEDAVMHSHRLITLDLLILYGIAKYCQQFVQLLAKEEGELKKGEKQTRGTLQKVLKEYDLKEEAVVVELKRVINTIKSNLQKEQAIVLGIEQITRGKAGIALSLKETITVKIRFIRYLRMRWEMVRARRSLQTEAKDLRKLMPILVHLDLIKEIHENGSTPSKIAAELKGIDATEKHFVNAAARGSEHVYDLFVNDFLVMRLIMGNLFGVKELTEKMAREHEIPLSIAQANEAEQEKILENCRTFLHQERQDILQVWNAIKEIKI